MIFPPFRSEEWIKSLIESQTCPEEVLSGIDLTPKYMRDNPAAGLYPEKVAATKESIRRALFRHSLFKIQNIEVTVESCGADRAILSIAATKSWFNWETPVTEELWKVDRCGSVREYTVKYYSEGDDGFSTKVVPRAVGDKIRMLRYYFS
jgi:hypothetical protein